MSPVELTECMYARYGLRGWIVSICDGLSDDLDGQCGHRSILYHPRTLTYGRGCLFIVAHEVAHALTPEEPGHGPKWRNKMMEILRDYRQSDLIL